MTLDETIAELTGYVERGERMDPVDVAHSAIDILGSAHPVTRKLCAWTLNKKRWLPELLCRETLHALTETRRGAG